jgi:hypothetical protein
LLPVASDVGDLLFDLHVLHAHNRRDLADGFLVAAVQAGDGTALHDARCAHSAAGKAAAAAVGAGQRLSHLFNALVNFDVKDLRRDGEDQAGKPP